MEQGYHAKGSRKHNGKSGRGENEYSTGGSTSEGSENVSLCMALIVLSPLFLCGYFCKQQAKRGPLARSKVGY